MVFSDSPRAKLDATVPPNRVQPEVQAATTVFAKSSNASENGIPTDTSFLSNTKVEAELIPEKSDPSDTQES